MQAHPITDAVRQVSAGDDAALQQVFSACYHDLRRLARSRLTYDARRAQLDTTALVHESYLRFVGVGALKLVDRQHFLRYASHVMRSVVVDIVRERRALRRGGIAVHVTLNTAVDAIAAGEEQILRVHEVLDELASYDRRMVQVVEMRYFAGMTDGEVADALGVTDRTVRRIWEKARLLLAQALDGDE